MQGLEEFHQYSMRPELYTHFEFPPFASIEESRAYLEKLIARSASADAQYWFIRLRQSAKIVGSFGLHSVDAWRSSGEIGYGVSPEYWGRGVFSDACGAVLKFAFEDLGLRRIVARTAVANTPSILGLRKMKFQLEGTMRDYYRDHNGRWFDAALMSRLVTD